MEKWIDKFLPNCCTRGRQNHITVPEFYRSSTNMASVTVLPNARIDDSLDSLSPMLQPKISPIISENEEKKTGSYLTLHQILPPETLVNNAEITATTKNTCKTNKSRRVSIESESRRSTGSSINSFDRVTVMLDQFKCAVCSKKATGFCIGCPTKRFCYECFKKEHSTEENNHRYCKYKTEKPKSIPKSVLQALQTLSNKKK